MAGDGDQTGNNFKEKGQEIEQPLSQGEGEGEKKSLESEKRPTTLEEVRKTTADSLESGVEFWRTTFGRENGDSSFMKAQNSERRDKLTSTLDVLANKDSFEKVDELKAAIEELQSGARTNQAETTDVPQLQQQLLELINQLFFEQLFADLLQCKKAIADRTENVKAIQGGLDQLSLDKLQEATPVFEQLQIDKGIFSSYLAHGEAMISTTLRSYELKTSAERQLKEIVSEYAELAGGEDLGKVLQIGGEEMADPLTYYHNKRLAVEGHFLDQDAFQSALDALKEKIAKLQTDPTQENLTAVETAKEELVEVANVDGSQASSAQVTTSANPQTEPQAPAAELTTAVGASEYSA